MGVNLLAERLEQSRALELAQLGPDQLEAREKVLEDSKKLASYLPKGRGWASREGKVRFMSCDGAHTVVQLSKVSETRWTFDDNSISPLTEFTEGELPDALVPEHISQDPNRRNWQAIRSALLRITLPMDLIELAVTGR